jgi:demethylmenaquinone methyltransferase / 2-methoxy-6-polyprenyl-1,4-benzoquinol methylase
MTARTGLPRPADPNAFARDLFTGLPARYDAIAYVLSFGQDRRWRRASVEAVAAARPELVLDVATGPAGVALAIAKRTGARVVGVDLTPAMLVRGKANVARAGRQAQIHLALARGEQLPFADATFDAVSFSYLLRYVADPAATVAELARVLKPGGVLAGLEFFLPPRRGWRALWRLHTSVVLPVGGALLGGREWWEVGRFLGPSIAGHYARHPLPEHVEWWRAAGITGVTARMMSVGGGLVMSGRKA